MTEGIILLALGHPYYGRMASILAASIKLVCDIPIHVCYQGDALNHLDAKARSMFNSVCEVPKEYTQKGFLQAKTFLYDLTPFDKTLYLDVDMIVWKDLSPLFAGSFNIKNKAYNTLDNLPNSWMWCNPKEAKTAYNLTNERWYEYGAEAILFEKNEANKNYFDTVKEIYQNPKIKVTDFGGGLLPDEFAFTIASAVCKHYPEISEWQPIYFHGWHLRQSIAVGDMRREYYGLSIGTASIPSHEKQYYNTMMLHVCNSMGIAKWMHEDKAQWIPTRKREHKWQPTT